MNNQSSTKNFIYGIRTVLEALHSGQQIDRVLLQNGLKGPLVGELRQLVKRQNIPIQNVPVNRIEAFTRKNHQGVVALLSPIIFHELENLIPDLFAAGKTPFLLALDKVTDIRNFGAICRTAECAGVDAILLSSKGAAGINADAVKSSAGALLKIPICRTSSLVRSLTFLKESGLKVLACTEKSDQLIYEGNYEDPFVMVMGSEDKGISREVLQLADQRLKIPLFGEIESLNVSVSAGIVLYEALRQKKQHAE